MEKRDVTGGSSEDLIPATQFLGIEATKLGDGNLSLHISGWGRADLGDNSYNDDKTDGSLTYGYLLYRINKDAADIRAGRFFVREGIVNEQVDGLGARTSLPFGFALSAFGGATVHTHDLKGEDNDGKGDSVFGGRISYKYKQFLELGASGVYEDDAPDLTNYVNGTHRKVGADIWLSPYRWLELFGHSTYNTETDEIAEHRYTLNLRPTDYLTLSGRYTYQNDQSMLYSWAMFSGAAIPSGDETTITGITATYALSKSVGISVDYTHYDREIGTADRYGGDVRIAFLDNRLKTGLGYHYLDADDAFAITGTASGSYQDLRAYAMYDTKGFFTALEGVGYFFKEDIYDESDSLQATFSLGYHLTPALALSGDISYGKDPDFKDETKGLVRLTYNMTYDSMGGKK
jgi:hypothetical protein